MLVEFNSKPHIINLLIWFSKQNKLNDKIINENNTNCS